MPALAGGGGAPSSAGQGGGSALGPQMFADKLDVLFVVDNSVSMLGKQQVLVKSLPRFVSRLTNPLCVDAQGVPTPTQPAQASAPCASGSSREFKAIADIHFGAISTSLGSHGGDVCTNDPEANHDDQGQLLPSKRTGLASYQDRGFLAFDATGAAGERDPTLLTSNLGALIASAGERGCGYEAPLEAMYRFLVDPEPPLSVAVVGQVSTPMGINERLLEQRRAFLRPDSSLAIVIFSDENDCSIKDAGLGWFVASLNPGGGNTSSRLPRATSACEIDPNDVCCRSCAAVDTTATASCTPVAQDSVCSLATDGQPYATHSVLDDSLNLRCFDQQRRFGFDILHPIERYAAALSEPKVSNRAGMLVDSPLFAARDGKGPRSASLVSVSVIVGAPWQDLATPDSSNGISLEYLDSAGLESNGRWPLLIGDKKKNVPPGDPLMIESIDPRTGQHPLIGAALAPATSTNPQQNPINGHEKNNTAYRDDLQHACIFPLPEPIVCEPGRPGCDCAADKSGLTDSVTVENSPLCQPPGGGPPGNTQYFGKAYPGTRELTFARQLGARAVSASICPKNLSDVSNPQYGYGPAFDALLGRIAKTIQ
ncbi:MAG TPA: hypothetical protein VJV79_06100 [Polyangiaceae bacterium]|nr:hypothetical protein [Polyangiaceae bacterium]